MSAVMDDLGLALGFCWDCCNEFCICDQMIDQHISQRISWCTHPRARHRHGTRAAYLSDGCRCPGCSAAAHPEDTRPPGIIDADPVREHLHLLRHHRMTLRQVATVAGVSQTTLWRVLYGRPAPTPDDPERRAPAARINARVAARILAVTVALPDGALVDASSTHTQIQELVSYGWSFTEISRRLNKTASNLFTLLRSDRTREGTRRRVDLLHTELNGTAPIPANRWEQSAITRAKRYAADHGWDPVPDGMVA